jgi:hypothetical protein
LQQAERQRGAENQGSGDRNSNFLNADQVCNAALDKPSRA